MSYKLEFQHEKHRLSKEGILRTATRALPVVEQRMHLGGNHIVPVRITERFEKGHRIHLVHYVYPGERL